MYVCVCMHVFIRTLQQTSQGLEVEVADLKKKMGEFEAKVCDYLCACACVSCVSCVCVRVRVHVRVRVCVHVWGGGCMCVCMCMCV